MVLRQRATDPVGASFGPARTGGASFASMFAAPASAVVQREPDEAPPAASEAAAPESAATAPAATPPAGAAGAGPSATELEEMARRLYEPLSARLRAELWLDRERAGALL